MTKILVVEDDRSLARLAQLNLEAEGYDVTICHEGRQAIADLQTNVPDLVLLDLRLPTSVSGWDVLTYLRQDHRLCAVRWSFCLLLLTTRIKSRLLLPGRMCISSSRSVIAELLGVCERVARRCK